MVDIRLIAGVGFAAFLVIFLVIAFFWLKTINQGQWAILRFLCALCAGGAGAFLTGEAVFNLRGQLSPGTDFAVSGTAGVALFLVVWYGFEKFAPKPPDALTFAISAQWSFQQAADALAKLDQAVATFEGFRDDELSAVLDQRQLRVMSVPDALAALRSVARAPIRPYSVSFTQPTYTLRITS